MKQKRLEAEITEKNETCKAIPLVKRAGSVLGAGAVAVLAVGAVGIYAFIGGNSIKNDNAIPVVTEQSVTAQVQTKDAENRADETVGTVSQAAVTWRKAGIEEYDLVVETVKATEKAKTTTKSASAAETTTTKQPSETAASTTAATEAQTNAAPETTAAEKQTVQTSDEEEVKSCSVMTMYTNDKVNMRKGPSLDDSVITVLSKGSEITVTGYTDDWYRIKFDGKTGYCMKRYATDEKPAEAADTSKDVISYTDEEFNMLCYVLQGEVGDCSEESKIAVANVIINRVKSSAFPNTIEGVLTQSNQFTAIYGYYNGSTKPSSNTIECAKRALSGEDNTNGAIYYYAPGYCGGSTAAWFESLTFCMELDGQRFFK